jgi:SAM-dependent methyltransferase
VLPLGIAQFAEQHGEENFDVVTFFEVLEHQAEPIDFLERVKACLRSNGYIAMSVPNRERWLTGVDPLDYPPNHFLRWNAGSLNSVLGAQGFEVLTSREEPVGIAHAAQMINMRLRTGLTKPIAGREQRSFREVMQMAPNEATASMVASPSLRQRTVEVLARVKHAACYPIAAAALPYLRLRGYKGTYLYCLARVRR